MSALATKSGTLLPKDVWPPETILIGCWTGGSMGPYLRQLPAYFGDAPVRDLGVATSTALLGRSLGVTLGASVLAAVYQSALAEHTGPAAVTDAVTAVYLVAIPIALVTVVLALRLPEHRLREHTAQDDGPGLPLLAPEL